MARSTQYWYDYMIAEKNSNASLNIFQPNIDSSQAMLTELTTTSKVARWRFFMWAVAACANKVDVVFDLALIAFEAIAKKSQCATLAWWIQSAYDFQYGDTLVLQNGKYKYATVNPAIQIIKRAAAKENGNIVNIKIAKLVGGVPTKLSVVEKPVAVAYFEKIKPAGRKLNIISEDPDELRLYIKVNFDALIETLTDDEIEVFSNVVITKQAEEAE